jgi:large subunit ribosomal protein L24e
MPRTRECDYCGADIEPGTGTMFVRTDGTTIHYCSSKCENNANLGREARDLEWTGSDEPEADTEAGAEPEPDSESEPEPDSEPASESGIGSEVATDEEDAEEASEETELENETDESEDETEEAQA